MNETARVRKVIRECLAKQELDIITVGLTFGEMFANENGGENDDYNVKKVRSINKGGDKNDKSRFISEMLEDFYQSDYGTTDGARFTDEKHIAICYK